jgi:hypothetical protein
LCPREAGHREQQDKQSNSLQRSAATILHEETSNVSYERYHATGDCWYAGPSVLERLAGRSRLRICQVWFRLRTKMF